MTFRRRPTASDDPRLGRGDAARLPVRGQGPARLRDPGAVRATRGERGLADRAARRVRRPTRRGAVPRPGGGPARRAVGRWRRCASRTRDSPRSSPRGRASIPLVAGVPGPVAGTWTRRSRRCGPPAPTCAPRSSRRRATRARRRDAGDGCRRRGATSRRSSGEPARSCTCACGGTTTTTPRSLRWAARIEPFLAAGDDVYVFFRHDPVGRAARAARSSSGRAPRAARALSSGAAPCGLAALVVDAVGVLGRPEDDEDDELLLDVVEAVLDVGADEDDRAGLTARSSSPTRICARPETTW